MASELDLKMGAWPSHSHEELLVVRTVPSLSSPFSLDRHLSVFNTGDKVPNQPGPGQQTELRNLK